MSRSSKKNDGIDRKNNNHKKYLIIGIVSIIATLFFKGGYIVSEGKVILITGASSGIGKITAINLSKKGMKVYGTSRKDNDDIKLKENNVIMLKMDVTDDQSVNDVISNIIEREGKIDVVFNNAGSGIAGSIEDTSVEEFSNLFDVIFFGTLRVCKAVLPYMRKRNNGLIINSSSIGGIIGQPYVSAYCSSKFAIEGFTESLSMEVKQFGIKVCIIEPGDFKTGFTKNRIYSKNTNSKSSYYKDFNTVIKAIEHDENNGADPKLIAKLIYKIINCPKPKLRYLTGFFTQKSSVYIKSFLPCRTFENMIIHYYHDRQLKKL